MNKKIIYSILVSLLVIVLGGCLIFMTIERKDYRNYLQGEYSKSMYQLIDSVKNIKSNLSKSAIINSREGDIITFDNIAKYADIANDKIHSMPISQQCVDGTSKFLSQVGDFAHSLSRSAFEDKPLGDEDYKKLENLRDQADYLLIQLNEMQQQINKGKVKWGDIRKKASSKISEGSKKMASDKFEEIQNQVVQYPTLIYDGPFSDNNLAIKPRVLSEKEVTEEEAKNVIKKVIDNNKIKNIIRRQDPKSTIPAYRFGIYLKEREDSENIVCEISKNGGHIIYLIDNRSVTVTNIDVKKAERIGGQFLQKIGYNNMESTYTQRFNNTMVVSYVHKQDGIMIYPDQIKLKIALDTGDIMGIESEKYLVSYTEKRQISNPKVSKENVMSKISKNLKVSAIKLAIIPTENNKEVLCYEIVGKYKDDSFIVYINAKNGYEQKILQLIKTQNGELTI